MLGLVVSVYDHCLSFYFSSIVLLLWFVLILNIRPRSVCLRRFVYFI